LLALLFGNTLALPRSVAAGAVTFGAPKATKNAPSGKASLPHGPYALQIAQNQGCKLFA